MNQTVSWLLSALFFGGVAFAATFFFVNGTNLQPVTIVIAVVVGAGATTVVYGLLNYASEQQQLSQRLGELTRGWKRAEALKPREGRAKASNNMRNVARMSRRALLLGEGKLSQIRMQLIRAGFYSEDALVYYLCVKLIFPVTVLLITLFVSAQQFDNISIVLMASLGMTLLASMLVDMIIKKRVDARKVKVREDLPDLLDLTVIYAETGIAFDTAMVRVVESMRVSSPEIAQEFTILNQEIALLPNRTQAYDNLRERVDLIQLRNMISILRQAETFGTPVSAGLKQLAVEMRRERMVDAERRAAQIPVLITLPLIGFILPSLFLIIMGPAGMMIYDQLIKGGLGGGG